MRGATLYALQLSGPEYRHRQPQAEHRRDQVAHDPDEREPQELRPFAQVRNNLAHLPRKYAALR